MHARMHAHRQTRTHTDTDSLRSTPQQLKEFQNQHHINMSNLAKSIHKYPHACLRMRNASQELDLILNERLLVSLLKLATAFQRYVCEIRRLDGGRVLICWIL